MVDEELNDELANDLQKVASAADEIASAGIGEGHAIRVDITSSQTIDYILDVTLQLTVEVGRARMSIQDLLQLGQGSVIELEKLAGEPLDVFMNGKQVARGEAVIVNEKFGVRITEVMSREERLERLS